MAFLELLFPNEEQLSKILYKISRVAERTETKTYLVGGVIRDRIMGHQTKDIDITVIGNGIEFAKEIAYSFRLKKVIEYPKFGTAMIPYKDYNIEVATARTEIYKSDSRKPQINKGNLKDDLSRRDFTINGLAMSLNPDTMFELSDYHEGLRDLDAGIIRTPLEPETTFSEDPLRMLRAVRFASQLKFKIEEKTFKAITKVKDRISIISQERITDEFIKILKVNDEPSHAFYLLDKCGLLKNIFPQLDILKGVEQISKHHHKDVFKHTLQVLDNIAKYSDKIELRFAALMHDIAKPYTKNYTEGKGWSFHGHEELGPKIIKKFCQQYKLPNKLRDYAMKLTRLHLRPIAIAEQGVTDSAIRRLIVNAGDELADLMILCRADITSKNPNKIKEYMENFDRVEKLVIKVKERDKMRAFQSPIRGDEIMKFFNLQPGKTVGYIKKEIEEAILQGKIKNEYQAAKDYMIKNSTLFLSKGEKKKES